LRLPAGVPARDFWPVCVYDLQSGQPIPSRDPVKDDLKINSDGSVGILFGPEPPSDKANNWIQTVPGKSWFTVIRLYGPLEPWFDKTWRPDDVQKI
jgi:hypothetical protein